MAKCWPQHLKTLSLTLQKWKQVGSSAVHVSSNLFVLYIYALRTWSCFPWILCRHVVPAGSPSRGGDVRVYVWHKPTELACSFLFCSCVYFCLYGPFNCISFRKFSWQLSAFSLCSSGLISALLVHSTYHFMKVSLSPDIIRSGWLGSKHQLAH